ncbi:hypothetical protein L486_04130 [Kwoniella mangroviensis CBS 10435]|uniref:Uncharacterized protein n=1 Tax=Kwoniella mangroviensis CBS 10435 TaxID=1331196 RepID=A0A1B9IRE0_9TREE|nr:uncharacterized protein I203_02782 [Kwoniella mangroviensis CBS 8507]OCF58101.1 hypothetical protein L486_04130 [Kwoniella mangroviensis CBS 10435]OCF68121.1 hypothetical protein I203_02782 [Kwoniella mangroviensis CBS 8507]OCF78105.1 hypothetical protein I204_00040 [Kwoniella mangroviensis CBS 8886]
MSAVPKYIYKIIPHSSVDARFTFPVPIPSSHQFLTELDQNDRYIHFSTAELIPGTLNLFFKEDPAVTLLRVEVARISAWKKVEWFLPDQTPRTGDMPYLAAHVGPVPLEGEYVESFKELFKQIPTGEKSALSGWDSALTNKNIKDWLV